MIRKRMTLFTTVVVDQHSGEFALGRHLKLFPTIVEATLRIIHLVILVRFTEVPEEDLSAFVSLFIPPLRLVRCTIFAQIVVARETVEACTLTAQTWIVTAKVVTCKRSTELLWPHF